TKTMQMIATAKFTAALQRARATQPYTEKIRQLVAEVSAAAGDVSNILMDGPSDTKNRELLLVITSDRGMCGAYNANILRVASIALRESKAANVSTRIEVAGKKGVGYFKFQKIDIEDRHMIGDKPKYEDVEQIASRFISEFEAGRYDRIRVAYMKYISNARQVPEVMTLLPLKDANVTESGADTEKATAAASYEFSPSSEALLADLLPLTVKTALFQAFNDAVVSEQIMKMIAMKAATENSKDLGRGLKRDFNRMRQTKITTELTEIVGGAAALE
ncbi:MAG: ATP synthase F1 subunit gamma, partial [Phycisphaerales bacterium]|nr:ATP synthase F1 subunit gamma [Phycisphaerales bacterium]